MSRCVFEKGQQKQFLNSAIHKLGINSDELGRQLNISGRTIRDWKREKYNASYEKIKYLSNISNVPIPKILELKEEWWSAKQYASQGGLRKFVLYGSTLTREDCRNGGINSWINRQANPELYKSLHCQVANRFRHPQIDNNDFAEFIGIALGDGGLTRSQLTITLNRIADKDYITYVKNLIIKLFNYRPSILERKHACATNIVINGVDFIKFIKQFGLVIGNKTRLQVGVPSWIDNINLAIRCVRGLMDTDGCIFLNRYKVNNNWYQYKKVAFANKSYPLLRFVHETMSRIGLHPIYYQNKQVRLCSEKETLKYLDIIGSSNPRLQSYRY
jgi:hypothetical protein